MASRASPRSLLRIVVGCVIALQVVLLVWSLRRGGPSFVAVGPLAKAQTNGSGTGQFFHYASHSTTASTTSAVASATPAPFKGQRVEDNEFRPTWNVSGMERDPIVFERYPNIVLTLIMATRNDGYGGNSSQTRVSITLRMLDYFAGKYGLRIELLLVEWNPPEGRPPVAETLPWLPNIAVVRVVKVPRWVHAAWSEPHIKAGIPHPPMYEFLAKNVGIRRASGRFIVGHALDTIITERWWEDVARHGLLDKAEQASGGGGTQHVLHRMSRADSVVRLDGSEHVEKIEEKLAEKVQVVWSCPDGVFFQQQPLRHGNSMKLAQAMSFGQHCVNDKKQMFAQASGDFALMTREAWSVVRGFVERNTYAHFDSVLMYACRHLNFNMHGYFRSISDPHNFYVIWHQGHSEGGLTARSKQYDPIVTPFWKYYTQPMWGRNEEDGWGMPRHRFEEVVWLHGKLADGKKNTAARDSAEGDSSASGNKANRFKS